MQPDFAGRVMDAVSTGCRDDVAALGGGFAARLGSFAPPRTAVLTSAQKPTLCQKAIPAAKPAPAHRTDLAAPCSRGPVRACVPASRIIPRVWRAKGDSGKPL